jgi:hypothetical protein
LLAIAACGGCASSAVVSQAASLADAGVAYGAAAEEIIPLTGDRYMDWNSESLLEELIDRTHCTPEEVAGESPQSPDCETLATEFAQTQEDHATLVNQLAALSSQAQALGRYFQNLKVLAEYDSATSASNAAGRAIDRINGLSDALEGRANITAEQKSAWSNLTSLVGDSIKAAKLRERLHADAADIGRAIDVQDGVLAATAAVLKGLDAAAREEAFIQDVQTPYLTGSIDNNARWIVARRAALFPGPEIDQLSSLESASEQLRDVWEEILTGGGSPAAAQRVFEDISRALDAVHAVRLAKAEGG